MRDNNIQMWLLGLCLLFLLILILSRKKITYPFCTLEKYEGRNGDGKANITLMLHLSLSLGISLVCYSYLNDINMLQLWFKNIVIRLSAIFLVWLFWIVLAGLLIEKYLQATDKDYREWKTNHLNK